MEYSYQNSTIAQILEAIISQLTFDGESHSNIGDILLSILNHTPYTDEPHSVLAELFLKLKAKMEDEPFEPYDKEYLGKIAEILISILEETEYTDEPESRIAELLLELKEELEAYTEITVSGTIVSFTTNVSKPLVKLEASVVATQNLNGQSAPYPSGGQLWDEEWENGYRDTTNGQVVPNATQITNKNLISVVSGTKIYFKAGTYSNYRILQYDANGDYLNIFSTGQYNTTVTLDENCHFVAFSVGGSTYNHDISINANSADTSYHPYSNICPIVGWDKVSVVRCGVNLWDEQWESGTFNSQGVPIPDSSWIRSKNFSPIIGGNSYYVKGTVRTDIHWYDSEKSFIQRNTGKQNNTVTAPNTARFCKITANTATYNNDISINYPSSDTDYHAYNGNTYTINLGGTYYGCVLDVARGVLSVTWARSKIKYINLNYSSSNSYFYAVISDKAYGIANVLSDVLANTTESTATMPNYSIKGGNNNRYIYIKATDYTDVTSLKNAIGENEIIYALDEPFTIQLTPTEIDALVGNNTIFADTGDIDELIYLYKGTPEA